MKKYAHLLAASFVAFLLGPNVAFAAGGGAGELVPIGIGLTLGLAAVGGTLGQGRAVSGGLDAIGRNPSAAGKITTPMYVGLAFIESLVIISFALAYLLLP